MKHLFRQLWLAVALIAAASIVLLASDRAQRRGSGEQARDYPAIAILQITSTTVLDNHVAGVIRRLEERGYRAPEDENIRIFNPQGDLSTANAIARDIVNGPYDLVITSSTLALQTFSKANLAGRKIHVFGAVTDPYGAGVGIEGAEPEQHPPYMAGIGTFQPVKRTMVIAREMNPGLRRVGVVWNPSEQCSEACLVKARAACRELGIQLVEAIAASTSEVPEAARSLLAREVDALWVGGDTVASASIGLIISLARQAGLPVFTNDPTDADRGALFGLGADYFTVGLYTADVAADVLDGKDPASLRIENVIPEKFRLNQDVLKRLGGSWSAPSSARASEGGEGRKEADQPVAGSKEPLKLCIVLYNETEFAELCRDGLVEGIERAGFVPGRDYTLREYNAQGDMTTLSSIMTSVKADRVDLLMTISTPALQAALRQAGSSTRIVFAAVADGVAAGAGTSERDHLTNVTGVTTRSAFEGMARIIRESLPDARRVGTLFSPAEINSVLYKRWLAEALKPKGIELVAVPVTVSGDVAQCAVELCGKGIQAVVQITDNLTRPGFALTARKALERNIPVYGFDSSQVREGAVLTLARDYYDAGLEAAEKAARVLRGQNPGSIPFSNVQTERLVINPELARRFGLRLSRELMGKAELYTTGK